MLTGLPWRPIITYGSSPTTIALTLPQKLWSYGTQLQGASSVFSAGNMAAYVFREDNRAKLTLRVRDCAEYLDVRAWIMDAMLGNVFTFQFDADDSTSEFSCRLDAPTFKDGFKPRRMADWPDVWEVDITIRNTQSLPIFYSIAQACEINSTGITPPAQWILTGEDAGGGLYRLATTPRGAIFPYSGDTDDTLPNPITDALLHVGVGSPASWITGPLTSGVINAVYAVLLGMAGTNQVVWNRMDATLSIFQVRDGVKLAGVTFTSIPHAGSFLGGGSIEDFDMSGTPSMRIRRGDQILLETQTYAIKKSIPADDGFRITFAFGPIFGPLQTTYMFLATDVTEIDP